jgi:hypothetical protein
VYGPVRTVVWQGSVGDRRPYADQVTKGRAIVLNPITDEKRLLITETPTMAVVGYFPSDRGVTVAKWSAFRRMCSRTRSDYRAARFRRRRIHDLCDDCNGVGREAS